MRLLADESLPVVTVKFTSKEKVCKNASITSFFPLSSDKNTSMENTRTLQTVTDDNQALSSASSKVKVKSNIVLVRSKYLLVFRQYFGN